MLDQSWLWIVYAIAAPSATITIALLTLRRNGWWPFNRGGKGAGGRSRNDDF